MWITCDTMTIFKKIFYFLFLVFFIYGIYYILVTPLPNNTISGTFIGNTSTDTFVIVSDEDMNAFYFYNQIYESIDPTEEGESESKIFEIGSSELLHYGVYKVRSEHLGEQEIKIVDDSFSLLLNGEVVIFQEALDRPAMSDRMIQKFEKMYPDNLLWESM